ncbi:MAG: hypothetical protein M3P89_00785 [Actinomycetota bacterium]|nr:hypothetical protein [Actinomycetota bacterium]
MYTEMALTARRFALTLAVAGIAGLGSIAVAPAASAADVEQDGPSSVAHTNGGNGPDAFIVLEHGVKPVFFCEPAKPKKQHENCTKPVTGNSRF